MRRSIIVAVAGEKQVIGKDNTIPWRLPSDLKRFKALTMGHCLIMGRKTYESIGRPLPGRTTIVLTRDTEARYPDGVMSFPSLDQALLVAKAANEDTEAFICGGGEVYLAAMLPRRCDRIYRTVIEQPFDGDTFFPPIDEREWKRVEVTHVEGEELPHQFEIWDRVRL